VAETRIESIDQVSRLLAGANYIAERSLATVVYLALALEKPLFVEGQPGVGKTEIGLALAEGLGRDLIRLQCYEGLDAAAALYEWNYPKQLLRIKLAELKGQDGRAAEPVIFSQEFLLERPLLRAIRAEKAPVLLIDEIDRADEEFEAFLLEILSEFQITIPELGVLKARRRPLVVITSNRTREIHDALKRRCLYHWIDYPDYDKELAVLRARLPQVEDGLAGQVVGFLQELRRLDFYRRPGLSETLDWAQALLALNAKVLSPKLIEDTLGCLLKHHEDEIRFREEVLAEPERRRLILGGAVR